MKVTNGFVVDAPSYVTPAYRISPFRTIDTCKNEVLSRLDTGETEKYLLNRFQNKKVVVTSSGRNALGISLSMLELEPNDTVTIFTTTNKFYISGCVTSEIDKYCQWSRTVEDSTKAILVNHEFGYCHQELKKYQSLGYPIIEDFAHSFVSDSTYKNAGHYADFLIFSFSKFFPLQIGGALIFDKKYINNYSADSSSSYVKNVVAGYIDEISSIKNKRIENYHYYAELFTTLNIKPYFKLQSNDCPGVFCFQVPSQINLNEMKLFINSNGIESSIFYGENAYFLPCHQNLERCDIDYIFTVIKFYLETYHGSK